MNSHFRWNLPSEFGIFSHLLLIRPRLEFSTQGVLQKLIKFYFARFQQISTRIEPCIQSLNFIYLKKKKYFLIKYNLTKNINRSCRFLKRFFICLSISWAFSPLALLCGLPRESVLEEIVTPTVWLRLSEIVAAFDQTEEARGIELHVWNLQTI